MQVGLGEWARSGLFECTGRAMQVGGAASVQAVDPETDCQGCGDGRPAGAEGVDGTEELT